MSTEPGARPRILLVGDDPAVHAAVAPLLENEGYEVERATLMQVGNSSAPRDSDAPAIAGRALAERWSLERLEREYILGVLEAVDHHQMKAAAILGIDRRTLYRKLREYRAA